MTGFKAILNDGFKDGFLFYFFFHLTDCSLILSHMINNEMHI